jgi:PucR family transcriptional regulator, purine catabolism regulatory protein
MTTVREVLLATQFDRQSHMFCEAGADSEVLSVHLFEDLNQIESASRGAFVVFTRSASREAMSYKLDMLIRRASGLGVVAVALMGDVDATRVETSVPIAQRARLSLISFEAHPNLAEVASTLSAPIHEDAEHDLERAGAALAALDTVPKTAPEVDEIVDVVAERLGEPIGWSTTKSESSHAASCDVLIEGEPYMTVWSDPAKRSLTTVKLVLTATCRAIEHIVIEQRRSTEAPVSSRTALLTEMLLDEGNPSDQILRRARRLGIAIDDVYAAICVEVENLGVLVGNDEVVRHHAALTIARIAHEKATASGGTWHRAGFANTVLLICADREGSDHLQSNEIIAVADKVLKDIRANYPRVTLYCGVGGAHLGFDGLRVSVAEARSGAARARLGGEPFRPYAYLGVGFRRLLSQWYAFDSSREMIGRLLAPLATLDDRHRTDAIRTLNAYLDHAGSPRRVATELGVHRNTVAYRIEKLFKLLDLDPEDPDHRLMLHLACRAVAP